MPTPDHAPRDRDDDRVAEWTTVGWRAQPCREWWLGQLVRVAYAGAITLVTVVAVPRPTAPVIGLLAVAVAVAALMMIGRRRR